MLNTTHQAITHIISKTLSVYPAQSQAAPLFKAAWLLRGRPLSPLQLAQKPPRSQAARQLSHFIYNFLYIFLFLHFL